jgi:hypothetical protein
MRKPVLLLLLAAVLLLNCCSNGADSLPELSSRIVLALSAKDSTDIWKLAPSKNDMEEALKNYFSNEYKSKEEMEKMALDRTVNNQVAIMKDVSRVKKEGRDVGIKWKEVKLANFSFDEHETIDAYMHATLTLTLVGGTSSLNTLLVDAVQYDDRWYLYESNLRWRSK